MKIFIEGPCFGWLFLKIVTQIFILQIAMSGFDNLNTDFYQTSYSIDDQAQQYGADAGGGAVYSK